jgi:hypothetical protein
LRRSTGAARRISGPVFLPQLDASAGIDAHRRRAAARALRNWRERRSNAAIAMPERETSDLYEAHQAACPAPLDLRRVEIEGTP